LPRRGEIATKIQELRPALSVNTQPNHVLLLAHFGAISDVYKGGVLAREVGALNITTWRFAQCICWWLVKPITGHAPSTAATLE
jgi:hypothetical protein